MYFEILGIWYMYVLIFTTLKGSKKQNTQIEPVNIEGDIPAMRPQGISVCF